MATDHIMGASPPRLTVPERCNATPIGFARNAYYRFCAEHVPSNVNGVPLRDYIRSTSGRCDHPLDNLGAQRIERAGRSY